MHPSTALQTVFAFEELQLGQAAPGIDAEAKRALKELHGEDLLLLYYLFEGIY
jgi:hypothetical protein